MRQRGGVEKEAIVSNLLQNLRGSFFAFFNNFIGFSVLSLAMLCAHCYVGAIEGDRLLCSGYP